MNWTRTHTLIGGLGLIALTNAVALIGAAWNRSGEEARLRLTQRELHRPYAWYGNRENSGLSLTLEWRVLNASSDSRQWSYATAYGTPAWLSQGKMKELGFDTTGSASAPTNRGGYEKRLPRDALIVLEMDGPAWQRFLEIGRDHAAGAEAKLAGSPGDRSLQLIAKNAREALERENRGGSRLFAIDAGLDAAALRAAYPDRSRYAIVHGEVRPAGSSGVVSGLRASTINVPLEFRAAIPDASKSSSFVSSDREPFEASVAFGKRLEPWIVEASRK